MLHVNYTLIKKRRICGLDPAFIVRWKELWRRTGLDLNCVITLTTYVDFGK